MAEQVAWCECAPGCPHGKAAAALLAFYYELLFLLYLLAALRTFSQLLCFQLAALLSFSYLSSWRSSCPLRAAKTPRLLAALLALLTSCVTYFYLLEQLEKLLSAARSTDISRHAPGLHLVSDAALLALECLLTLKVSKAASNAASRAASK